MFLVLSRHEYTPETPETVLIGSDIEIRIVRAKNGKARIAIKAPPHVTISRNELLDPPGLPSADETPPPVVAEASCAVVVNN